MMRWSLGLYLLWTGATWLLEGRLLMLLRPDAVGARVAYVVLANMLVGTLGALWVLRRSAFEGVLELEQAGFRTRRRIAVSLAAGTALGLGTYLLQGAPSLDPVVVLNGFCQTLTVSVAEVLVCWAVIGAGAEALLRPRGKATAVLVGAAVSSVLFGLYHLAHSPPFNTVHMVLLLTCVGLATSLFFFLARDVYGTIVFHNFLAVFGVVQALAAADELAGYAEPKPPLYLMAAASVLLLAVVDFMRIRGRHPTAGPHCRTV
jgi:hypothetical protein